MALIMYREGYCKLCGQTCFWNPYSTSQLCPECATAGEPIGKLSGANKSPFLENFEEHLSICGFRSNPITDSGVKPIFFLR